MKRMRELATQFLEATGLDWLPVVLSDRFYVPHERYDQELTESFESHQLELTLEQIKHVVLELSKLTDDEENRQNKIEAKALSLISFTGLSSAFIAGLVTILGSAQYSHTLRQRLVIVYSLLLLSLFVTVVLAIKAIRVGKYSFMSPHVANLWSREGMTENRYYRDQARALLRSYVHNRGIINDKASFVAGAQDWFRNTIFLLMLMTVFIVFTPSDSPLIVNSCAPTYTPVPTVTYTAIPVPSPTSLQPTSPLTPIATP